MTKRMRSLAIVGAAIVVIGLTLSLCGWTPLALLSYVMNSVLSAGNPTGTLSVEVRSDPVVVQPVATSTRGSEDANSGGSESGNWPSYNRTVTSGRFSPLSQINTHTVGSLKILCSYDTKLRESFQSGLIVVNGALIGTTALDTFSIDPANCHENWRVHEEYKPAGQKVNRGAAYLDGRVFRGFLDGQVRAYDFKSGRVLWKTAIADPARGDLIDAAPIASQGLVFVGIALGDVKGFKGRMYALAADTGRVVWETYLVPKAARPDRRPPVCAGWESLSGFRAQSARRQQSLHQFRCRPGCAERFLHQSLPDLTARLARLGRFQRARVDSDTGRQTVAEFYAQEWLSIWAGSRYRPVHLSQRGDP